MFKLALCTLAAGAAALANNQVSYKGHQVVRVVPGSAAQLEGLRRLRAEKDELDFWLEPSTVGRPVDLRLTPSERGPLMAHLKQDLGLAPVVQYEDVQDHLDQALLLGAPGGEWDANYHSLEEINTWMQGLVANHSKIASMYELGQTYENRTVYGIKITGAAEGAPQIYLDGGIHAREWIAPAVVQHIIATLLGSYASDPSVQNMVDTAEWYITPVFNADGYHFTWANDGDRLWRKNRQPNKGARCLGTDPCRNADAGFGGAGSSNNACSDTYHGPAPFSVPIVQAWKEFVTALPNLQGYVNFHSYADSWLTAYGYSGDKTKDYTKQEAMGKAVTEAIKAVHGTKYNYGPAYTTIYPASGIPSDWLYDNKGVVYTQACELSGNSFTPPPTLIKPNGEEIFQGMKVMHGIILSDSESL